MQENNDRARHEATWANYTASWRSDTPEARQAIFRQALAPECVYTDPLAVANGWAELLTYMEHFNQQFPGAGFETTRFFAHRGRSVAQWNMVAADGTVLSDGTSYAEYDDAGRLVTMTGFYDVPDGS